MDKGQGKQSKGSYHLNDIWNMLSNTPGMIPKSKKDLHNKITAHLNSGIHQESVKCEVKEGINGIKEAFQHATDMSEERASVLLSETIRVFRTVYFLTKENLAWLKHPKLVRLQMLNGLQMGTLLFF